MLLPIGCVVLRKTPRHSADSNARVRVLIRYLAAASTLLYALSRFLPSAEPQRATILDESWKQALHVAFRQHFQFGRDIVFTFGPWGFLYGGYDPGTYWISVIVWAAFSLMIWWVGWRIARHFFRNDL